MNRINAHTRVIAVWMPNNNSTGESIWESHRVSVDKVEKQIGYDLLSNVPESGQRLIEAGIDRTSI
ncbi:hypothetical protein [Spirosoma migulaei]